MSAFGTPPEVPPSQAAPAGRYAYASPPLRPGLFARQSPTLAFYRRALPTVWQASAQARKGLYDDDAWYASTWRIIRAFEAVGVPLRVEGLEHLHSVDGPVVIVGNHMSTAETFMLAAFFLPRRRVTFVVKRELVEYPVFKHIMRSREPVVVGRSSPKHDLKAILEEGPQRLEAGYSVVVFPQRTRAVTLDPAQFNSIGVKLARRAGVQVVPLALKTDAWTAGAILKDFGTVALGKPMHIAFGPAFAVERDKTANARVIDFIQQHLTLWQREDAHWRAHGHFPADADAGA